MNISIQKTSDMTTLKRLWAELYDSNPQLTTLIVTSFAKLFTTI
jgi:hypothetical protein